MSPLNCFTFGCLWSLTILNFAIAKPMDDTTEGYLTNSRLSNYRNRFALLAAKNVDDKYSSDLNLLIEKFNAAINSNDLKKSEYLLENYAAELEPEFASYLQYELDAQRLNQDINMEKWFLQQLLLQLDGSVLVEDIQLLLPLYDKAKEAKNIDDKYEYFTSIESEIPQSLLDFFEIDPSPVPVLNAQLQYFHEFLVYLLQEGMAADFETDIKSLLNDVDRTLSSETSYEEKANLINLFDRGKTNLERFLNAKAHEFELYKFGSE